LVDQGKEYQCKKRSGQCRPHKLRHSFKKASPDGCALGQGVGSIAVDIGCAICAVTEGIGLHGILPAFSAFGCMQDACARRKRPFVILAFCF
jgi:hypothetical protein